MSYYFFSGRVQGVGFRQTTVALAEDMPLGGTVRNLPDGRVELTVEGSPTAIDQLVTRLREHFGEYIRNVDDTIVTPRGFESGIQVTW